MRKISFAEISIFVVNRIFNWRFWIAELTKKSKIAKKVINKMLFEKDDVVIISNTITINEKIEGEASEFLPTDVIKEVIKKCDDIVIMDSCLCRTSNNCEDYPQDIGCIFLGPTSRKIPRAICHEASVEEALKHVDDADAAGLSHIIGRNKIDSVWMNVRPGEGLLTICHCCPCCCLWKVVPNLHDDISEKIYRLDNLSVTYNEENCKNCLKCLKGACMFDAISLEYGKISINQDKCRGCGLCANACKFNAININYNEKTIDGVVNRVYNLIEE
ncbi:MAG: 4Fe-4S binding protein [Methanobrevibacter sp.]|nr:4Fe-4S binding protein [Methanobrevibacter sp.]